MKTIIKSVFLVAILALVITGCQKEGDDLNVSLKSTIAFTGGIYISPWQSGNAEFECAQAGGCDGGSYKMDQGVYAGSSFNGGGVTITGISKQEFSWSSIYPVCKIIVKAGNGAYIFEIGGAQSGSVPYPKDLGVKEKDISHITFCFALPKVITLKFVYTDGISDYFGVSDGTNVFSAGWCSEWYLGVNNYPTTSPITLHRAGIFSPSIGTLTVDAFGDVTINLNEGLSLVQSSLFVGTEADLKDNLSPYDVCPAYYNLPWIHRTSGDLYFFDLPNL